MENKLHIIPRTNANAFEPKIENKIAESQNCDAQTHTQSIPHIATPTHSITISQCNEFAEFAIIRKNHFNSDIQSQCGRILCVHDYKRIRNH